MGKKSSPTPPAAPDPVVVANAQAAANADTARLTQKMGMVDTYGPNGSVVYRPLGPSGTGTSSGSTGSTGSTGGTASSPFNASAYLAANTDLGQNYSKLAGGTGTAAEQAWWNSLPGDVRTSPEAFAQWHYNTFGQLEGRPTGATAGTPTTASGVPALSNVNYASALNNGMIDPYQGLAGGKAQYDAIRRAAGYQGDFGGGAFEGWLKSQPYATQVNYINQLNQAGADPDYVTQLIRQARAATDAPQQGVPSGTGTATGGDANADRWAQYTILDPASQEALDREKALTNQLYATAAGQANRVATALGTPLNANGLPELTGSVDMDTLSRDRVEQALFDRLNPQLNKRREALETQLINMGFTRGSEGWNTAMDDLARETNDARLGVIAQGGNEQSRLFGLNAQNAQLANAARGQGLQERAYIQNIPINQISALLSQSQVSMPQGIAPPQVNVQPTDVLGAYQLNQNAQLAAYNAKMQQQSGMMGGLFGLGSAAILASDRRVKRNIRKVGKLNNGLPVYAFRYKWGGPEQIGVMAQDVEKVNPAAVHTIRGVKHVDYAAAVG